MDNALLRSLRDKENQCRNLQRQADEYVKKNNGNPCEEQFILLQRAADIEADMAGMTIGAERDHHIREQQRLDYEIRSIRSELERKSYPASGKSGAKKIPANNADPSDGKSQEEQELDRAVRTWYKDPPKHSFEDVSGMEELKKKLNNCIADAQADELREYLKIPKLNSYFFVGPPGCGKTMISEAFAHELMKKDYKFISILGSDIISKYVGTAEKSVTRLFEEAAKSAPCIVFIDEIDSLCKSRSLPNLPEYAANITTSFLTGYNKIHSEDSNVIFIAATNYPNRVDSAMLDRAEIIRLPLPDKAARSAAFEREFLYRVNKDDTEAEPEYRPIVKLKKGLTYDTMAEKTRHYNYRDIERLTSALKNSLFKELLELFGDQHLAIDALEAGKFQLSAEKFDEIAGKFKPSPKEQILSDLTAWEIEVQSTTDYSEAELRAMYDSESLDSGRSGDAPAEVPAPAADDDTAPVYPLEDTVAVDAETGEAVIRFAIGARAAVNVKAVIDSAPVAVNSDDSGYYCVCKPDSDQTEIEVFIKDDNGYIGSFTVAVAAADNED